MSTSTPAVSVVMPFFNGKAFMAEAISSVLAQTWRDLELILVDDGSTDGSRAVAERHADLDPRVRVVAHPGGVNRGAAASRNAGVAVARASRLAFIDADDRWSPAKLAEQQAIMDRYPKVSLVAGSTLYWSSWNGGTDYLRLVGATRDRVIEPPEALLYTYPLGRAEAPAPSSIFVTAAALARVGGFEEDFAGDYGLYEDQAFLVKIYLREPVYFSSCCWFDYRQHQGSVQASTVREGRYLEVRQRFLDWLGNYLHARGSVDQRVRRRLQLARARLYLSRVRRLLASP